MSHPRPETRLCVAPVAALRAQPDGTAEQVTQVLFGERLLLEGQRDGWLLVRTGYDYPGWVMEAFVSTADPLAEARAYLGAPYEWGGMTAAGIDCSGLVHMAFRRAGVDVPRDADQQEAAGTEVAAADARPGDLVTYGDGSADHVAFWLGEGAILHATGREGVEAVVEEPEPAALARRRRKVIRLDSPEVGSSPT